MAASKKRKRAGIPNSVRFEVFKRDSFACQYCGLAAPGIVLQLDHIDPHAKGGGDDILNLVTSCVECNSGKGARRLDDNTVVEKQKAQLDELAERRTQLEMVIAWREGLRSIARSEMDVFAEAWRKSLGLMLSDIGIKNARPVIRKSGLPLSLDALDRAVESAAEFENGVATLDSAEYVFNLWRIFSKPADEQRLYLIRARIRERWGRWGRVDESTAIRVLKRALDSGASVNEIDARCTEIMAESHTDFRWWVGDMEAWIVELLRGRDGALA
jgi:hypothetical protein